MKHTEAEFKTWQKGQAVGMVCAGVAAGILAFLVPEMSLKHYSVVCALVGAIYRFRL